MGLALVCIRSPRCPRKPLLKVGEKPILELILENFIKLAFTAFVSRHYLPEMVREHFGDGSQWGVEAFSTPMKMCRWALAALAGLLPQDEIDQPMIVMNGDLLTTLNFRELLSFHLDHESEADVRQEIRVSSAVRRDQE